MHLPTKATGPTVTTRCRMATLVSYFATIMSSCDGFTMGSMGSERRVLALLRADTLKVYAAVFDTVARGQLSGSTAENAAMTCGTCRGQI